MQCTNICALAKKREKTFLFSLIFFILPISPSNTIEPNPAYIPALQSKKSLYKCYITLSVHSSSNFLPRIPFFCTFALWAEKIAKAVSKYAYVHVCVSCSWQITACSPILKYWPQIERTTAEDKCDIRQAM